jgi:hypothetical protein
VYSNLPAKVAKQVLCHAGQKVYDCAGCVVGVVAYSSTFDQRRASREIVVWEPDLGRVDTFRYGVLYNRDGKAITGVAE